MMDAVERIARVLAKARFVHEYGDEEWEDRFIDGLWPRLASETQTLVEYLKTQGIPIDKLLSGEMVAVPVEASKAIRDEICFTAPELYTDAGEVWGAAVAQAKADYAGK